MIAHVPEWERSDPRRFLDVNIGGTVNVLEWARGLPALERLVYISTGGVYGDPTAASPDRAAAGGRAVQPARAVPDLEARLRGHRAALRRALRHRPPDHAPERRLRADGAAHLGPHDHVGRARHRQRRSRRAGRCACRGGASARAATSSAPRTSPRAPCGCSRPRRQRCGTTPTTSRSGRSPACSELLEAAQLAAPALAIEIVEAPADADIDMDPADRLARWNAYAIERARTDLGWAPRPLRDATRDLPVVGRRRPPAALNRPHPEATAPAQIPHCETQHTKHGIRYTPRRPSCSVSRSEPQLHGVPRRRRVECAKNVRHHIFGRSSPPATGAEHLQPHHCRLPNGVLHALPERARRELPAQCG